MAHETLICSLVAGALCLSLLSPATATAAEEHDLAAGCLREQGIMIGDSDGKMNLDEGLTRAQLAVVLARLNGASVQIQAQQSDFALQCSFPDVPEWAKPYVGYCYANGLMVGYDTGKFGAQDGVTPAAACTVILRYTDLPDAEWDYSTACQTALSAGLTTTEATSKTEVTRGDLAVMLYRAMGRPAFGTPGAAAGSAVSLGSYKGNTLKIGERSLLIVGSDAGTGYSLSSSSPSILAVEQVDGNWVAVAKAPGTATATITTADGRTGSCAFTISADSSAGSSTAQVVDLNANMAIREEIIALVNQVRRENGVGYLAIDHRLMDASQERAEAMYTYHRTEEDCAAVRAYGYPYGFGANITAFTGVDVADIAQRAVENWVNSPGHFQTMINPDCDTIGVGVAEDPYKTVCYLFVGNPNASPLYE